MFPLSTTEPEEEMFSLFPKPTNAAGDESNGIVQVQAQVLRKLLATETFNTFFS
jgi:hypothetical protein